MNSIIYFLYISGLLSCYAVEKVPITLDTTMIVSNDLISKTSQFKGWTTFKIINEDENCIGNVYFETLLLIDDDADDINERIVYQKLVTGTTNKYIIRIVTDRINQVVTTDEFLVKLDGNDKYVSKIFRTGVPLDVNYHYREQNTEFMTMTESPTGWIVYKIRDPIKYEYRIGDVTDGDIDIIRDSEDSNIISRTVYKTKIGGLYACLYRCTGIRLHNRPNIVRVYTYYSIGERRFDEFIETETNGRRLYTELIRTPITFNISTSFQPRYITKYRLSGSEYGYRINNEHKHKMRIGKVVNGSITVAEDEQNIRVRYVYLNTINNTKFEKVHIKTCYDKGDCVKCKFVLNDNGYTKTECISNKYERTKDTNTSVSDLLASNENIDGSNVIKSLVDSKKADEIPGLTYKDLLNNDEDDTTISKIIRFDISEAKIERGILCDILPNCNGIYCSVGKDLIGTQTIMKIQNNEMSIAAIDLSRARSVEFVVKIINNDDLKQVFLWAHYGKTSVATHEIVLIDPQKNIIKCKRKPI